MRAGPKPRGRRERGGAMEMQPLPGCLPGGQEQAVAVCSPQGRNERHGKTHQVFSRTILLRFQTEYSRKLCKEPREYFHWEMARASAGTGATCLPGNGRLWRKLTPAGSVSRRQFRRLWGDDG